MVVLPSERIMTLCKKHNQHLCWHCILEREGLQPPGYEETILVIKKLKQEAPDVKK